MIRPLRSLRSFIALEFLRHWRVLPVGVFLGLVAFVSPSIPILSPAAGGDSRSLMTVLVASIAGALLLATLVATTWVRGLADREFEFLYARPLSARQIWFARIFASSAHYVLTVFLALAPTLLTEGLDQRHYFWSSLRPSWHVVVAVALAFLVIAASIGNALVLHLRAPSIFSLWTLLCTAAAGLLTYRLSSTSGLWPESSLELTLAGAGLVLASGMLAGSFCQVRASRAGHREAQRSHAVPAMVSAVLAGIAFWAASERIFRPSPRSLDFEQVSSFTMSKSGNLVVLGLSRPFPSLGLFLMSPESGRWTRMRAGGWLHHEPPPLAAMATVSGATLAKVPAPREDPFWRWRYYSAPGEPPREIDLQSLTGSSPVVSLALAPDGGSGAILTEEQLVIATFPDLRPICRLDATAGLVLVGRMPATWYSDRGKLAGFHWSTDWAPSLYVVDIAACRFDNLEVPNRSREHTYLDSVSPSGEVLAFRHSSGRRSADDLYSLVDLGQPAPQAVPLPIGPGEVLGLAALDSGGVLVRLRGDGGVHLVRVAPRGELARLGPLPYGHVPEMIACDGDSKALVAVEADREFTRRSFYVVDFATQAIATGPTGRSGWPLDSWRGRSHAVLLEEGSNDLLLSDPSCTWKRHRQQLLLSGLSAVDAASH